MCVSILKKRAYLIGNVHIIKASPSLFHRKLNNYKSGLPSQSTAMRLRYAYRRKEDADRDKALEQIGAKNVEGNWLDATLKLGMFQAT